MEFSIYVCPKCRRTFRSRGMDKKIRCVDCNDTYLKDMHLDVELWKTFNTGARNRAIAFTLGELNSEPDTINGIQSSSNVDLSYSAQPEQTAAFDNSQILNNGIADDPAQTADKFTGQGHKSNAKFVIKNGVTEYKCPNCNARLTVREDSDRTVCEYCGAVYLIDDERQRIRQDMERSRKAGFEFERGRMEAQNSGAGEDILEKLAKMIDNAGRREELLNKISGLRDKISAVSMNVQKFSSLFYSLIPYLICAGAAIISIGNLFESSESILSRLIFLVIGISVGYFGMRFGKSYIGKKQLEYSSELYSLQNRMDDLTKELDAIRDDPYIEKIPPEYRALEALKALYDFLVTKRAFNIQQAITLYEDKKRNDEILRMHKEQIEFQKKEIEDLKRLHRQGQGQPDRSSSADSSIGSALAQGVATAVTYSVIKHIKDELF